MLNTNALKNADGKFLVLYAGQKLRAEKENDKTIFIYAKGKRSRGYRIKADDSDCFQNVTLLKIQTESDRGSKWQKDIKRAIKIMQQSGLWGEVKQKFENLINSNITHEEIKKIRHLNCDFNNRDADIKYCIEKGYNFMLKENANKEKYIDYDYIGDLVKCKLKSMYFGKWENSGKKEKIKQAINERRPYHTAATVNYDVSFSYEPEKNKAWYSEEYRGCGNGHYYLALDHNTAIFYEKD